MFQITPEKRRFRNSYLSKKEILEEYKIVSQLIREILEAIQNTQTIYVSNKWIKTPGQELKGQG